MSLKTQVLCGGTYLVLRQGLGVIISFAGEILSFVKIATGRISIATLTRLQGNRERLLKAVSEGMGLQILALGPLLALVSWISPWLIPLVFGSRWLLVVEVYPFIRPLAKVELTPSIPPKRGEEILLPLHPSLSPLKGERSKDEAFYSREGWGGVSRIYARGLLP